MKAVIVNGQLAIVPGNQAEHYALIRWLSENSMQYSDPVRVEKCFIRASAIKITQPLTLDHVPPT
jgi:hypothetical protein